MREKHARRHTALRANTRSGQSLFFTNTTGPRIHGPRKRIATSQQLPPSHIAHGLPLGCDEADSCGEYSTFTGSDGDLPYFSGAMEVWRGLRDLARMYDPAGDKTMPRRGFQAGPHARQTIV